jgi:phosphatidylglycerol:prolipoprotein diacylglycerol transferase
MGMRPIPVVFHLGPLQLHTYGLGLAVTFWFAYRYLERRLRDHGYPYEWLGPVAVRVIVAALIGARLAHVLAHLSVYAADPVGILEVWQGGLSSFGGLAFGLLTGFYLARRRLPGIRLTALADLVAPVLLAGWTVGRLLGPQLMVRGGGHPTHQWFGMYYAGEVGKRLPVPLFQAAMTFAFLLIVWRVERKAAGAGGPVGIVAAVAVGLWGAGRFTEEHLWLATAGSGHGGALAVEIAGIGLAVAGFTTAAGLLWRHRRSRARAGEERPAAPVGSS